MLFSSSAPSTGLRAVELGHPQARHRADRRLGVPGPGGRRRDGGALAARDVRAGGGRGRGLVVAGLVVSRLGLASCGPLGARASRMGSATERRSSERRAGVCRTRPATPSTRCSSRNAATRLLRTSPRRPTPSPTSTTATRTSSGRRRRAPGSRGSGRSRRCYEWDLPYAKWFLGGTLNACYNCVDRHVENGHGRQGRLPLGGRARGRPPDDHVRRSAARVVRAANALKSLGVEQGHAGRRLHGHGARAAGGDAGAARASGRRSRWCSAGSAPDSLSGPDERHGVPGPDHAGRGLPARAAWSPLKANADAALEDAPTVETVVVAARGPATTSTMRRGPRRWWHDVDGGQSDDPASCPCEPMDSEDLLYLLYTSGTTAKPKGIVHTTGGYLVGTSTTHHYIFDIKPETRVLVRGRHRLGHRPQLHRVRAAGQRHHRRHVRGHAGLPRQGPVVGHRRALQGRHPLHRPDGHPHAHEVGPRVRRRSTTCRRCGCSAPSASRSTPRRGCGTASTSAAAARPWSTPGGRPRPA